MDRNTIEGLNLMMLMVSWSGPDYQIVSVLFTVVFPIVLNCIVIQSKYISLNKREHWKLGRKEEVTGKDHLNLTLRFFEEQKHDLRKV